MAKLQDQCVAKPEPYEEATEMAGGRFASAEAVSQAVATRTCFQPDKGTVDRTYM